MAKIIKPKLTNAVSDIKIDNFNFSNNSKVKKANLITDINNTITDYLENNHQEYNGKIVNPNLKDILKDGDIESFLQQFHIFDFNETTEEAAPAQDSSNDSGSSSSSEPKNDSQNDDIKNKSVDELAREVLEGKYGNGQARKDALGDRYDEVQKRVEELIKNPSGSSSSSSQTNNDSGEKPEKQPDSQPTEEPKPQGKKNNGIPAKDANGYIIRQKSDAGQKVINMLLANGHTNSPHSAKLDAAIDNLSAEECAWVLSRIENEGFGQTSDGYYRKSVQGDQNFIDRQLIRRYNGDIHNLLKAWGTYSYSGY